MFKRSRKFNESTPYGFGRALFRVIEKDITTIRADVLVSSDDNYLRMAGGVSLALRKAAGPAMEHAARKQVPASLGDVVVTPPGDLPAKHIFHCVVIDLNRDINPTRDLIATVTHRCLELAEQRDAKKIVFPALGTGVGGLSAYRGVEAMVEVICKFLAEGSELEEVVLTLWRRKWWERTFYDRINLEKLHKHIVEELAPD